MADSSAPTADRAHLWLLIGAITVACAGQHLLTPLGASRAFADLPHERAPVGFALLLLAGTLAAFAWRPEKPPGSTRDAIPPPAPWALYTALGLVGIATAATYISPFNGWAIYPWTLGLAALFAGTGRVSRSGRPRTGIGESCALAAILVIATAMRWWQLADLPAQVHGDEAACGLEARRILAGEVPNLLGLGWYDIPYISFAISAAFMALFGDDLFGLRTASVFQGVASIAVLHFLVRRLYGARAGLLAATLLALSNWHIHFSRIGTDYMQASLATLLAHFFFVRARQDGSPRDWLLAGYAIGLGGSVYFAGRVSALIIAALLVCEWWEDRGAVQARATGITAMALGALLFVAPTVAAIARQPHALTERPGDVFVLAPNNLAHSYASSGSESTAAVLAMQTRNSLSAFNWRGDRSDQHAHRAPLLDFVSAPLFAAAAIACTVWGWHRHYRLLAIWFWLNLVLGSVLTVDAMFSPRMVAALPAVFVFPALLLDRLHELAVRLHGRRGGATALVGIAALLGGAAFGNYSDYFDLHVSRLQPAGSATVLSRFVAAQNERYRVYVYGPHTLHYDTPRFLVPEADGRSFPTLKRALPLAAVPEDRGAVFIVAAGWDDRAAVIAAIRAAHREARHDTLRSASGHPLFDVWWVEAGGR